MPSQDGDTMLHRGGSSPTTRQTHTRAFAALAIASLLASPALAFQPAGPPVPGVEDLPSPASVPAPLPGATLPVSTLPAATVESPAPKPQPDVPLAITAPPHETRPLGPASAAPPSTVAPQQPAVAASAPSWTESLGIGKTLAALAGVIAIAIIASSVVRSAARRRGGVALGLGPAGRAPSGVVHVLARYPIQRGQLLVLLKVGPRVILTCQSRPGRFTGAAMTTLAEFTDPDQVAQIVRLTQDPAEQTATGRFRSVLEHVGMNPLPPQATPQIEPPPARPSPRRVMLAESGDRAEISSAADQLTRRPVPPPPRSTSPHHGGLKAEPVRHPHAAPPNLDGAEQLRRRLARLRAGGHGETT